MSAKSFMLKEHIKYSDTSIELALDQICVQLLNIKLVTPQPIWHEGKPIRPDRQIPNTNILLEADGYYHFASAKQLNKTKWRDEMLVSKGFRILHIPADVLLAEGVKDSKKFWQYVSEEIKKFQSNSLSVWSVPA